VATAADTVETQIPARSWWGGTAAGAAVSLVLFDPSVLPVDVGWRVAFGLGAVLGLAILLTRRFLPESPRWLMTHGRADEAERIVAGSSRRSGRRPASGSRSRGSRSRSVSASLGPLLLGRLFDVLGRRAMIAASYGVAGVLLAITGWLFERGTLTATTQTAAWTVMLLAGAVTELVLGVEAEQRTIEEVAEPLSAEERDGRPRNREARTWGAAVLVPDARRGRLADERDRVDRADAARPGADGPGDAKPALRGGRARRALTLDVLGAAVRAEHEVAFGVRDVIEWHGRERLEELDAALRAQLVLDPAVDDGDVAGAESARLVADRHRHLAVDDRHQLLRLRMGVSGDVLPRLVAHAAEQHLLAADRV
jgi:hypothetical protein